MEPLPLPLFLLGTAGLTLIITKSRFFAPVRTRVPRKAQYFVKCSQCMGTWVGGIVYGFVTWPWGFAVPDGLGLFWFIFWCLVYGAANSAVAMLIDAAVRSAERYLTKELALVEQVERPGR